MDTGKTSRVFLDPRSAEQGVAADGAKTAPRLKADVRALDQDSKFGETSIMAKDRKAPDDALGFIQQCVRKRRVYWTYHVNMRLAGRHVFRNEIFETVDTYEIVESYPDDKYLPSYLIVATPAGAASHVLSAAAVGGDNVRVVTAFAQSPPNGNRI